MALPGVKIIINTSGIGSVQRTADGIAGMLVGTETDSNGNLPFNDVKQIFSLKDAENLGITETATEETWRNIKQFYDIAGEGAELWVKLFDIQKLKKDVFDLTNGEAKELLQVSQGRVKILGIQAGQNESGDISTIIGDIVGAAQSFADWAASRIMPIRILVGAEISNDFQYWPDLKQYTARNVGIVVYGLHGYLYSDIGYALGRLASIPVQRNIGRVKDGPFTYEQLYINGQKVEKITDQFEALHDKGYIFPIKYEKKAGYYFNDDHTCVSDTDDFSILAHGRVIDKAIILAYLTYLEEVKDEVDYNKDGTLKASYVKALQSKIEKVINKTMTSKREISAVKVMIDPTQNVSQTNDLDVSLQILPVGYAKYINVTLGMTNVLNS